jgi:hypothetical protein
MEEEKSEKVLGCMPHLLELLAWLWFLQLQVRSSQGRNFLQRVAPPTIFQKDSATGSF